MHTMMVVGGGLILLLACWWIGRAFGSARSGLLTFLPLWLIGAGANMWIGVTRAGYSVAAELPIMLLVFGIPAAVALLSFRRIG